MGIAATLLALVAVAVSAIGLITTTWASPSEKDWFKEALLDNRYDLRRYHIISMLGSHQQQHAANGEKARLLRRAEKFLVAGASVVAAILLWRAIAG